MIKYRKSRSPPNNPEKMSKNIHPPFPAKSKRLTAGPAYPVFRPGPVFQVIRPDRRNPSVPRRPFRLGIPARRSGRVDRPIRADLSHNIAAGYMHDQMTRPALNHLCLTDY